jgi:hypothetical protein
MPICHAPKQSTGNLLLNGVSALWRMEQHPLTLLVIGVLAAVVIIRAIFRRLRANSDQRRSRDVT